MKSLTLVLACIDGVYRQIAKLEWSDSDASLYIRPKVANGGSGRAGVTQVGAAPGPFDVDTSLQGRGSRPYLSLHESGQTHAKCFPGYRSDPVHGRPLSDPTGGHIASIDCFDPSGLPVSAGEFRGYPNADLLLTRADPSTTGIHAAIFVLGETDQEEEYSALITLKRATLKKPLLMGLRLEALYPGLGDGGVIVTGGWGPGARPAEKGVKFVYATSSLEPIR